MNAGLVEPEPDDGAQDHVRAHAAYAQLADQHHGPDADAAEREHAEVESGRVAERDHQDGADVVHDGQRQQHDAQARRNARAHDRQAAHGEGDVGGHRDAPAARLRRPRHEREVEGGRDDHAAQRGGERERGPTRVAKLAEHELALHLEPDDEEEDPHQAVVDPVLERVPHLELAPREADLRLPQREEVLGERRVGEREGRHREDEQNDSARRLDVHEAEQRTDQPVDALLGQARLRSSLLVCHDPPESGVRRF